MSTTDLVINPFSSLEEWIHFQSLHCCCPHFVKNNFPLPSSLHLCLHCYQFQAPNHRFLL